MIVQGVVTYKYFIVSSLRSFFYESGHCIIEALKILDPFLVIVTVALNR
jgi:hypothetical protein